MASGLNQIRSFPYTDVLGWSVSRYDKFTACKRQYFYEYYGKHDTAVPRARIQALKSMTGAALETGSIVHDVIKALLERLLKSEARLDTAKFMEFARRLTEEHCRAKTFAEVYYGEKEAVRAEDLFAGVERNLRNLVASDRYKWILASATANKTGWVIEPPGYGETRIGGLKAYCKVDFLFPVEGNIHILDWKTGRADEVKHRKQLIGYSTWASCHFEKPADAIFPVAAYLQPEYREMRVEITQAELTRFVAAVEKESREMYGYCSNVEQNLPVAKERFTPAENRAVCRYCNYRELCR